MEIYRLGQQLGATIVYVFRAQHPGCRLTVIRGKSNIRSLYRAAWCTGAWSAASAWALTSWQMQSPLARSWRHSIPDGSLHRSIFAWTMAAMHTTIFWTESLSTSGTWRSSWTRCTGKATRIALRHLIQVMGIKFWWPNHGQDILSLSPSKPNTCSGRWQMLGHCTRESWKVAGMSRRFFSAGITWGNRRNTMSVPFHKCVQGNMWASQIHLWPNRRTRSWTRCVLKPHTWSKLHSCGMYGISCFCWIRMRFSLASGTRSSRSESILTHFHR
jgi:hypothetical protein